MQMCVAVLYCVAACGRFCSVLHCINNGGGHCGAAAATVAAERTVVAQVCCSVMHVCVAVCVGGSVLQYGAACCSMLQFVVLRCINS